MDTENSRVEKEREGRERERGRRKRERESERDIFFPSPLFSCPEHEKLCVINLSPPSQESYIFISTCIIWQHFDTKTLDTE